jgi:hypothetical protein
MQKGGKMSTGTKVAIGGSITVVVIIIIIVLVVTLGKKTPETPPVDQAAADKAAADKAAADKVAADKAAADKAAADKAAGTPGGAPTGTDGTPLPAPAVTIWDPLKNRLPNETGLNWSNRIYSLMALGRTPNPKEGGVNHNVGQCGLNGKQVLDQATATCLCENPCYWYKDKTNANACNCAGGFKAVNF